MRMLIADRGAGEPISLGAALAAGKKVAPRATALLAPGTIEAVGSSATQLRSLLVELNALTSRQSQELAALSSSLRRSAEGIEGVTTGGELARSVARIDTLTARLAVTSSSLDAAARSLDVVLGRVERGEGTLGLLSADDQLYTNLNSVAENLNALVLDIQANPRRYIDVSVF